MFEIVPVHLSYFFPFVCDLLSCLLELDVFWYLSHYFIDSYIIGSFRAGAPTKDALKEIAASPTSRRYMIQAQEGIIKVSHQLL